MQQNPSRLLFYLNTLYEFTHEISGEQSVTEILQRLLRIVIGTGITRGIVLLKPQREESFRVVAQENLSEAIGKRIAERLGVENQDNLTHKVGYVECHDSLALAGEGLSSALVMVVPERLTVIFGLGALLAGKPLSVDQTRLLDALARHAVIALGNALLYQGLLQENQQLKSELERRSQFDGIVGQSPPMQQVYDDIQRASQYTHYSVFITGETGTGKELIAKAIHHHSGRSGGFVPINCAALPTELIESELFGHERGAFSGADKAKPGLFEKAEGGTLFLDEITEMPLSSQAKLLRVLQEKKIRRVGGRVDQPVDVRVIAASNREVDEAIADGTLRRDLYQRFLLEIHTPALRDRRMDIPQLVTVLLERIAQEAEQPTKTMSTEGLRLLMEQPWPGNVRDLEKALIQSFVRCPGQVIRMSDLALSGVGMVELPNHREMTLTQAIDAYKRQRILAALDEEQGNVTRAAKLLGISRQNLQRYMRTLRIAPDGSP